MSFDEPNWETGKNVWWRFRRADGAPWGLAGLWNTWTDKATGEIVESYTMLTLNADAHPLMSRMHKPDPKLGPDQQDKRSRGAHRIGGRRCLAQRFAGGRCRAGQARARASVRCRSRRAMTHGPTRRSGDGALGVEAT